MHSPLISLVGLPGSGKSTVGRQLARRLQLPFVDSDRVIEERIGCSIRDYFEREGEDRFREVERSVIEELAQLDGGVIATGGGAVLSAANRSALRRRSTVVYLRALPEALLKRVSHDVKRPLLQVADPLARLRELFAIRDPLYGATAHFVIETGRPSVPTLVNTVLTKLHNAGAIPAA